MNTQEELKLFIQNALREDVGDGDHSTLASIPSGAQGASQLIVKADGIIAGIAVAQMVFHEVDPSLKVNLRLKDGDQVKFGDVAFVVEGNIHGILKAERLVLNIMQRMSGIATETNRYVKEVEGTQTQILDTRKTTPGLRLIEKMAVTMGGGTNHRMGLYDMVMLKDNHNDFAGGITLAVEKTKAYLKEKQKDLKIEVEVRNFQELDEALSVGVDRVMLDNFNVEDTRKAVEHINKQVETEASGGITFSTIKEYASTGVDFISVGALTHSVQAFDLSLKAL